MTTDYHRPDITGFKGPQTKSFQPQSPHTKC